MQISYLNMQNLEWYLADLKSTGKNTMETVEKILTDMFIRLVRIYPCLFTMDSVSELDMLLSLALVVAENKNEMKNISQLPSFIYPGDSEFISEETHKF